MYCPLGKKLSAQHCNFPGNIILVGHQFNSSGKISFTTFETINWQKTLRNKSTYGLQFRY